MKESGSLHSTVPIRYKICAKYQLFLVPPFEDISARRLKGLFEKKCV